MWLKAQLRAGRSRGVRRREMPPVVRKKNVSVLTTFSLFHTVCMRNNRVIIENVAECSLTCAGARPVMLRTQCPAPHLFDTAPLVWIFLYLFLHNNGNNNRAPKISWISRKRLTSKKKKFLPIMILFYTAPSVGATFSIFHGACMEEHKCEAKLPHIPGNVVTQWEILG